MELPYRPFSMKRINYEWAYSADGACTNTADEFSVASVALEQATTVIPLAPNDSCYDAEAGWRDGNRRDIKDADSVKRGPCRLEQPRVHFWGISNANMRPSDP
jgi:hypothetical protein